jgi:hypothetical protein
MDQLLMLVDIYYKNHFPLETAKNRSSQFLIIRKEFNAAATRMCLCVCVLIKTLASTISSIIVLLLRVQYTTFT